MRVRKLIPRVQSAQCVNVAISVKIHPRLTLERVRFVPLAPLPAQVIWEGLEGNIAAPSEALSDDDSDWLGPYEVQNGDALEVGSPSVPAPARGVVPSVNVVSVSETTFETD